MDIMQVSDTYKTLTDNDKFEYKQMCNFFKEMAREYETDYLGRELDSVFNISYTFNTSESNRFFVIIVKYTVKKGWFKHKVFFSIKEFYEVSHDDYLDIMNEIKEIHESYEAEE
jgi:hypothetical protein